MVEVRLRKGESPRTLIVDAYYEESGVPPRSWSTAEVNRLADSINITPFELGKLFWVEPVEMRKYLARNNFPKPLCLHFEILKQHVSHKKIGSEIKPLIPIGLFVK